MLYLLSISKFGSVNINALILNIIHEHCELCKTVESQICTSETNNAIYVKKKKKKKKVAGGEE